MRRTIETILAILFASASILFVAFAAMVGRQTLDENADNSDAAYIVVAVTGLVIAAVLGTLAWAVWQGSEFGRTGRVVVMAMAVGGSILFGVLSTLTGIAH